MSLSSFCAFYTKKYAFNQLAAHGKESGMLLVYVALLLLSLLCRLCRWSREVLDGQVVDVCSHYQGVKGIQFTSFPFLRLTEMLELHQLELLPLAASATAFVHLTGVWFSKYTFSLFVSQFSLAHL